MHKSFGVINVLIFLLCCRAGLAQSLTADQAVAHALKNNPGVQAAELFVREAKALRGTSTEMGKFSVMWMSGEYNSVNKDNNITLSQSLPLPTTMAAQARLARAQYAGAGKSLEVVRNELAYEVRLAFNELLFLHALKNVIGRQDSILNLGAAAMSARHRAGESTLLEKISAETQAMEARNLLRQQEADIRIQESQLKRLLFLDGNFSPAEAFKRLQVPGQIDTSAAKNHPVVAFINQQVVIGSQYARLQKNLLMPDLNLGYFSQSLVGFQNINGQDQFFSKDKKFTGIQVGLSMPLWAGPQLARSRAATLNAQALERKAAETSNAMRNKYLSAMQELDKAMGSVNYYETSANMQSSLIIKQAQLAFQQGELDFNSFMLALKSALQIQTGYLIALKSFNNAVINIQDLNGQN
jgi:cobalt-zinc-cadmium resistance protein CzcA